MGGYWVGYKLNLVEERIVVDVVRPATTRVVLHGVVQLLLQIDQGEVVRLGPTTL